jgi:hypothetical protein
MQQSSDNNYLVSGHMLNCAFGTSHNAAEDLFLLTPSGIIPFAEAETQHKTTQR